MSEYVKLEDGIIEGVSKQTIEKLNSAGVTTLQALASQKANSLAKTTGIGEDTLEKAIRKAVSMVSSGYITAAQLEIKRSTRTHLKTGAEEFDNLLGGGVESETTTEIIGAGATGKTQICSTLAVVAQQSIEEGGLGGKVAWIDTEGTMIPARIREICLARGLDPEKTMDGIFWALAHNTEHQRILIEQLYDLIPKNNIKLVIVDSMMGHLRAEFIGRATLNERQGDLGRMLQTLLQVALSMKVTVVYSNQVVTDPSIIYGNAEKPAGGNIMSHAAGTRVHLRKGRENTRVAKLIDSLSLPEGEAIFRITERGIEDANPKE
jgi:DNA repair protein RadA